MANSFKSNLTSSIGTSSSNVYICQAATQTTVIGMTIANKAPSTITANVMVNSGGTMSFLTHGAQIASGQTLVPIGGDQKLVLEAGDFINVQSSLASSADVIVSVLEIT